MDDQNIINEEISSHQHLAETIDNTLHDNRINLVDTEEEGDLNSIHSIDDTNHLSMLYDNNYIHKYYAPFLLSKNN